MCRIFIDFLLPQKKKVYDGTDMTMLQSVTRLMGFKSKFNFSNQCYNDIVKFVTDLIPVKHEMAKDLYNLRRLCPVSE
jgi:hypothetical protein